MASQSFESDSAAEQASTTADEVEESSRRSRSTTDDFDEDSVESTTDTDSNNGAESMRKARLMSRERRKYADARLKTARLNIQSDTETKNLLDDVGEDIDDDYMNLQEDIDAKSLTNSIELDSKLFELSEEQTEYYTNCFLCLLEKSQGYATLQGALQGTNQLVLDFFRKSQLDDCILSRIWALSDVNEDGFLNYAEFLIAIHLVVLHAKAKVPIPSSLPFTVRPLCTPTRTIVALDGDEQNGCCASWTTVPEDEMENSSRRRQAEESADTASTSNSSNKLIMGGQIGGGGGNNSSGSIGGGGKKQQMMLTKGFGNDHHHQYGSGVQDLKKREFGELQSTAAGGASKQHSFSDDHLHTTTTKITMVKNTVVERPSEFSDIPPLLVDNHPTALNAATSSQVLPEYARLLASSTRGPPPQPPHRDYNNSGTSKGHGRSVSLDLKTFSALSVGAVKNNKQHSHLLVFDDQTDGNHAHTKADKSTQTFDTGCYEMASTSAQTDCTVDDYEEAFSAYMRDLDNKLSAAERCKLLQVINDRLETERATLMQVRLQVQLRVEEAESQLRLTNGGGKERVADGLQQQRVKTTTKSANRIIPTPAAAVGGNKPTQV